MELKRGIVINGFRAELLSTSELLMMGTIGDVATRDEVRKRLDEIHLHIVQRRLGRFLVDVHGLEFVDSSAIRLFVDLTAKAGANGYVVVFVIDPRVTWQRLSFSVLKTLAPGRVELQDVRRAPLQ